MSDDLSRRLRDVRLYLGLNAADMADRVGLKDRKSWERYERDETAPKADALAGLAALGFDINWLLTGNGQMLRDEPIPAVPAASVARIDFDEALHGQVVDGIEMMYREADKRLPAAQLARIAARVYADLINACAPEERAVGLRLTLERMRRELRNPGADGATSKLLA